MGNLQDGSSFHAPPFDITDVRLKELAVIVIKTENDVITYPTVETIQEESICKLVYAPARTISEGVNKESQKLAKSVVESFQGKGIFGVEMFLLEDDTVLLNELAPRVHNSIDSRLGTWALNID